MANGNGTAKPSSAGEIGRNPESFIPDSRATVHPSWAAFVRFCEKLQHGEIERLRIQDGLPVLAEVTTKKIKFS